MQNQLKFSFFKIFFYMIFMTYSSMIMDLLPIFKNVLMSKIPLDLSVIFGNSSIQKLEQLVNMKIYIYYWPFETSWGTLDYGNLYNWSFIFLLCIPIVCSLYIFYMYLYYYTNVFNFGLLLNIEEKFINLRNRSKKNFHFLFKNEFFLKKPFNPFQLLPRPSLVFNQHPLHFLWKKKVSFLVLIFAYPFSFFHIFHAEESFIESNVFYLIAWICFSFWFYYKVDQSTLSYGLTLKHFLVNNKKFSSERRYLFNEKFFSKKKTAIFPIACSFFIFIITNYVLLLIYLSFFFDPILTWNGYFSQTIISVYFQGSLSINKNLTLIPLDYFIALDGLNLWLLWLTNLLVFLCSLFCFDKSKTDDFLLQMGWIFLLQFASLQFFCVCNYLWMYIFFELSLLPIFILIIFWGSNRWKVHAAYQMVIFTFVGSVFLLIAILMIFNKFYTFNTFDIFFSLKGNTNNVIFSLFEKKIIWFFLFLGFAVKTPLYPFHIWLPEAHSEAPTTGSVLLAGVLLKMGTYGFLRYVIPLFPDVLEYYKTLIYFMCLSGILFSSMSALAQIDIKKIIAYSSIGHMGLVVLGICSQNSLGLLGSSFMMISHGLISGALFFSIGLLYKIYGTRSILHYSGIAHFMPRFSLCFFIFSLANMGFPGTAGFPAEILIFSSIIADNLFLTIFASIGSILGGCYSIWLLTRVIYGQISPKISVYRDLKPIEWKILIILIFFIIFFGIFPFIMIDFFKPFCSFFVTNLN